MPSSDFNQIPEECRGRCGFSQADIDKHDIVLSLKCDGPSYEGPDPQERIFVQNGEVVEINPVTGSALGRVACTNRGAILWLLDRKEQFNGTAQ